MLVRERVNFEAYTSDSMGKTHINNRNNSVQYMDKDHGEMKLIWGQIMSINSIMFYSSYNSHPQHWLYNDIFPTLINCPVLSSQDNCSDHVHLEMDYHQPVQTSCSSFNQLEQIF